MCNKVDIHKELCRQNLTRENWCATSQAGAAQFIAEGAEIFIKGTLICTGHWAAGLSKDNTLLN